MVAEESWEQICSGLVSKGICEVMPVCDLYHIGDTPVLNGMFGVSKDEFDQGVEVMRLIMNLVPVNKLCRNLGGDVATLTNWSGMGSYLLDSGEVLLMSSEDIRCFFYLFSVPQSWKRFLGFNKLIPPRCTLARATVCSSQSGATHGVREQRFHSSTYSSPSCSSWSLPQRTK